MSFKPDVATPWPGDSEQRQQLNEGTGDNVCSAHTTAQHLGLLA